MTCGADTHVKIFDADNIGAEPRTIEHHDSPVTTLAINAKGKYLATGTEAHMVQYFGFPSCEFQKNLTRAQSPIQHVAFDAKGKLLAVGGDDGVIRMVNCAAAQCATLKGARTRCCASPSTRRASSSPPPPPTAPSSAGM